MPEQNNNARNTLSRRAAITAAAALPLSAQLSVNWAAAPTRLSNQTRCRQNATFARGDMDRWFVSPHRAGLHADTAVWGPASHGFDASPERLAELARYFRNGETSLEVAQAYASDGLVVLVMIERQRAEVGGLPRQDWSLRVTEVYRKDGSDWQLVHRHADPLTNRIALQQAAALARGDLENERS
jgi:ketosteroid isomerase-like protein